MIFFLKIKDDTNTNTILAYMIIVEKERANVCYGEITETYSIYDYNYFIFKNGSCA